MAIPAAEVDEDISALSGGRQEVEGAIRISGISTGIGHEIQWARNAVGMLNIRWKETTFRADLVHGRAWYSINYGLACNGTYCEWYLAGVGRIFV